MNDPFPVPHPHKVKMQSVSTLCSNQEGRDFGFECQGCKHVKSGKYFLSKQPCVKFTELVTKGLQLQTCKLLTPMKTPDVEMGRRSFHLGPLALALRSLACHQLLNQCFPRQRSSGHLMLRREIMYVPQKVLHGIHFHVSNPHIHPQTRISNLSACPTTPT